MGGKGSGGHNRLSDAERASRGNPDKRHNEDARATKKVVNLFAHPRLDTVPDPEFPMGSAGKDKYRELAEMLLKSGQLTVITKGFAETAALTFETISALRKDSKVVSASLFTQYSRALGQIQQFDIDRHVATAEGQRKNKFAYAGFSTRLKKPRTRKN